MRILDLDNCIADDAWRICLIDKTATDTDKRYEAYHKAAVHDDVGNVDLFQTDEDIAIFTARPLRFRNETLWWMGHRRVPHKHLLMRNNHDHRPSVELKSLQLQWLLAEYGVSKEDISCAYDDRPDVIQMYRELHNIKAERRFIHTIPYVSYCP